MNHTRKLTFEQAYELSRGSLTMGDFDRFVSRKQKLENRLRKTCLEESQGKADAWEKFYQKNRLIGWVWEGAQKFNVDLILEVKHFHLPYRKFRIIEEYDGIYVLKEI